MPSFARSHFESKFAYGLSESRMIGTMIIEPLKAEHGDAIVICIDNESHHVKIVVDGGPLNCAERIADYYDSLGYIDLLILTHYDEDHIGGLLEYLGRHTRDKSVLIGEIWVNGARLISFDKDENVSSYDNAYTLASCIVRMVSKGIIRSWVFKIHNSMDDVKREGVTISFLTPTLSCLEILETNFQRYVDEHGLADDPDTDEQVSYGRTLKDSQRSLETLADEKHKASTTFMNKTSISFILYAEGKSIMMLGDADIIDVEKKLRDTGFSKESPMHLDLVKLSHHGSKGNISKEFLEMIDCNDFLFTTNGGTGGAYHPDRKTIALIKENHDKKSTGKKAILHFNYPLETIMDRTSGLLSEDEQKSFVIADNTNEIIL